ncbi:MAG: 2-dehydropantoate 2-reductase [Actinomycetota bacterium]
MHSETPRGLAILGPGSIGGAVAVALSQAGRRPTLAARQAPEQVVVHRSGSTVIGDIDVLVDADRASPCDVLFVAVKAHQTASASTLLAALVDDASTVFICQNGVEHIERLAPHVQPGTTLVPVVVDMPANRAQPGVVEVGNTAQLTVPHQAGELLSSLLAGSFITVRPVEDWLTAAWIKLALNAAVGGICTLTRTGNHTLRDPEIASIAQAMMAEIVAVGRAEGAALPDDLPDQILSRVQGSDTNTMSSIVRDRIAGRPTEWDARNAVIGRTGTRHNIPTPVNDLVTALISAGEPPTAANA